MLCVSSAKRQKKRPNDALQNIGIRWLQSFLWAEVAHFGPLDGPLSMDLEVPFFRPKLGRTSVKFLLSFNCVKFHLNPFSRFWLADLFPKILVTNRKKNNNANNSMKLWKASIHFCSAHLSHSKQCLRTKSL